MREFVVDVPAAIRVIIKAEDSADAGLVAGKIVDSLYFPAELQRVGGAWQLIKPELVPLDPLDAVPEVFVCDGQTLSYVGPGGLEPTDDACPRT